MDLDTALDPAQNFRSRTSSSDYPEHRIYVGDSCVLKSDEHHMVGLVTQTHADLERNIQPPLGHSTWVECHPSVSPRAFREFRDSGTPPQRTVLLSWSPSPNNHGTPKTELLSESAVKAIDRELSIGDAVRRNPDDAISGIVIKNDVLVNLYSPVKWPRASSELLALTSEHSRIVYSINASELVDSLELNAGTIIYYQGWIGMVADYFEAIKLRLQDGSVIQLGDAENLQSLEGDPVDDVLVGDLVETKKGNLRQGRAIYGQYNPNVQPRGYVAEVVIESADIDWLVHKPFSDSNQSVPDVPLPTLTRNQLDEAIIYGRNTYAPDASKRSGSNICVGDKVRFENPASLARSRKEEIRWVPRQGTLGFDINVYEVAASISSVQVQWQDNSVSTHPSVALVPVMDFDYDDEFWPGELVTTRASKIEEDIRTPERVGIVQSVKSRDRIATVKWFEGTVSFFETRDRSLMPGSWTGLLIQQSETVSLYDIWTEPGLPRRLGDFLAIVPPFGSPNGSNDAWKDMERYREVRTCLEAQSQDWFGEVVDLGINGLLKLHLGASGQPRDVQIPWECTLMAYSTDLDDSDEDEEMEDADGLIEDDIRDTLMHGLRNTYGIEGGWVDEHGQAVDGAQADDQDWSTDDEDNDEAMASTSDVGDTDEAPTGALSASFTYQRMLESVPRDNKQDISIENFAVLEGKSPPDHHFANNEAPSFGSHSLRRLQKEHKTLRSSLPAGVFVRTWESALHLIRVLILGPLETPYEYAPFLIDMFIGDKFPSQPPRAYFHSWTDGGGPVNPNLYEDGKICLSLLGTWPGSSQQDTWSPKATLLQILVSLLGLVLVQDPYYNEAGFEVRAGSRETRVPSAVYAERSFLKSRNFINRALNSPVQGFERELETLYLSEGRDMPMMLARAIFDAITVIHNAECQDPNARPALDVRSAGQGRVLSAGAVLPLKRMVNNLLNHLRLKPETNDVAERLQRILDSPSTTALASFEETVGIDAKS